VATRKKAMRMSKRILPIAMASAASLLLLLSLRLPLWQMRLEAPQYREQEALRIAVHPNSMRGDLKELKVLNQYIGVHVPPTLPQFRWLPAALICAAVLGLGAGLVVAPIRRPALVTIACALVLALGAAGIQARSQMRDIGHKRDQKTILAGMRDFTPPFLGTTKIAQFTVTSRFGPGAWVIACALALQLAAAQFTSQRCQNKPQPAEHSTNRGQPAEVAGRSDHNLHHELSATR
jgi:copper chaperone NosL